MIKQRTFAINEAPSRALVSVLFRLNPERHSANESGFFLTIYRCVNMNGRVQNVEHEAPKIVAKIETHDPYDVRIGF